MSDWLKAGLIGAAVAVVLSLLNAIPNCGFITWLLGLAAYGCIGALAVHWMPSARMPGPAAGHGALAAVIAAAIGGVVGAVIPVVQLARVAFDPAFVETLSQMPDALEQFEAAGIDPASVPGIAMAAVGVYVTIAYGVWLGIAAGIGALGGAIFAAMNPEGPAERPVEE